MEGNCSKELQRGFTGKYVKECVANIKNKMAEGAVNIGNEFYKHGKEGMIAMMPMLYNWIWESEYIPKSRR